MKIFIKLLIWLLSKAFESKERPELEPCIKNLYRRMVKEEFEIKSEIVKVKKGKRRYDLLFLETPEQKIKINLSRHWESEVAINSENILSAIIKSDHRE
jgi:hypothetical protein